MIPGSSKDHPSFVRPYGYAIEGFITAVRTERNINVMLLVGALTVIAGLVIGLDLASWCIIAICCGLVIHAELCNTAIEAVVDAVIAANPDEVARYKEGNTKLIGFFVGQCMKEMRGQGNPKVINQLLAKKLNA